MMDRRAPQTRRHRPGPARRAALAEAAHLARAALARRAALLADPDTNVARVLNGAADGADGLVVEKLADVLIAQQHEGRLQLAESAARAVVSELAAALGATAVYRKMYARDRTAGATRLAALHTDPQPWIGTPVPAEFPVREAGLTFLVRPYDGYQTGLFLDHRENRRRVRELAAGRRALNTFAYTCAHTVVAAAGGATATVSVDVAKGNLARGRENLAANGFPLAPHRFIGSDTFDFFRRATRQGHRFDLILLDPPTFSRTRRPARTFELARDLDRLAAEALALLDPGGVLLISLNHRGTRWARLRQAVEGAAAAHGRRIARLERIPLPEDFAGDPDYAKSVLARLE